MNINNIKNLKFAHRGLYNNLNIPENSIRSFQKAVERKIPIELDIHILKDNTLVVFHDNNLKRMTGIFKKIKNCNYKELENLNLLKTDYKIPTLNEVLKIINGQVLINIEIKNDNRIKTICKKLCDELSNYNGDFIIQAFSPKIIKWFKYNKPNYIRGLLISDNYYSKLINYYQLIFKYCSPQFLSVSKYFIQNKKIQDIRKNNIPIIAWTIKKSEEFNKYKTYADSFICNNLY